jgi:hypothetical protein
MLILLLTACGVIPGPCEQLSVEICDACPLDDYSEATCTCIEEGDLTPADFPDGYDLSEDEASYQCESTLLNLRNTSDDARAFCQTELKLIRDFPKLACEDMGYSDDDTTTYFDDDSTTY